VRDADGAAGGRRSFVTGAAATYALLFCMGAALGVLSLYFASAGVSRLHTLLRYFAEPLAPLLNILPVVLLIFALYFIFNRVWAAFLVCACATITASWVNYFKMLFRGDPLMAADLGLLLEAGNIGQRYSVKLDWQMIATMVLCALLCAASAVFVRRRARSISLRVCALGATICVGAVCYLALYTSEDVYSRVGKVSESERWSAAAQYKSRGFIYPFLYSIKSARARPPEGYDEREAAEAFAGLTDEAEAFAGLTDEAEAFAGFTYDDIPAEKKVNIVAVMCEAFNDFSKFGKIEFTYDVYGPLRDLRERSLSGELVVNVFAGGTVDTEWAFLTGFSQSNGEFRGNVNSYVRYLKEQGYVAESSHIGDGWFYNRMNVNDYLGFDNNYFLENHYSALGGGSRSDDIFFPEIMALYERHTETSDAPYFSFNVTYQNHGPYDAQKEYFDREYAANTGLSRESYLILNNYFSGVANTVENIARMAEYFAGRGEPVLFIVFGDHNPWMGNTHGVYTELGIDFDFNDERGFTNYYGVPYIVFANDAAKRALGDEFTGRGENFSPCFLLGEIFARARLGGNEFMKASNEVRAITPVIHTSGVYSIGGQLTKTPPEESMAGIERFMRLQFYWRHNFKRRE
jgi:phosphoglycerol transferase MdoB-like AlkP superfamily enzyme